MYLTQSPNHGAALLTFTSFRVSQQAAPQHAKLHEAAPADPSSELGVKKPLLYFHVVAMLLGGKHNVLITR
jgi:hypothetical protein